VSVSWILLDWSRDFNEFVLLSDSHSQPRAKINLGDHSNATLAENFLLEKEIFESMFKVMPNLHFMNATFVENFLSLNQFLTIILSGSIQTQISDTSVEFAGKILKHWVY
jgi:hypothetical protein